MNQPRIENFTNNFPIFRDLFTGLPTFIQDHMAYEILGESVHEDDDGRYIVNVASCIFEEHMRENIDLADYASAMFR